MPDPDPCTLLKQADTAYFQLAMGGSVREVQDQNGERVVYNTANRAGLLAVITQLQQQCPTYKALALSTTLTKPTKFFF